MRHRWFLVVLGVLSSVTVMSGQKFSGPNLINPLPGDVITSADFNNDGNADLIYVQGSANTVAVSLSNGDGTFRTPVTSNAGSGPGALAIGDFNADGKLDAAVTNVGGDGTQQNVAVLLGNGDGTFRSPTIYKVGGVPNSITVADLNNDNLPDIAVIASDKRLTILTNASGSFTTRTFKVPTHFDTSLSQQDPTDKITAGDFNGDHKIDLAYVDNCESNCSSPLETFWILTNKGGGQFSAAPGPLASGTSVLKSVDIDLDGLSDLLSVYYGCHTPCVGVLLNFSNGDGTWDETFPFDTGSDQPVPLDAAVGDYNNDGKMDIAMVTTGGYNDNYSQWINPGVAILDGQGGRDSFAPPVFFSVGGDMISYFGRVGTTGFFRPIGRKDLATDTDRNAIATWINKTVSNNDPCSYPTQGGVHICSPTNNSKVSGAVHFVASARAAIQPLNRMELWVDGVKKFQLYNDRTDTTLNLAKGQHSADVVEVDAVGHYIKGHVTFTVQ